MANFRFKIVEVRGQRSDVKRQGAKDVRQQKTEYIALLHAFYY